MKKLAALIIAFAWLRFEVNAQNNRINIAATNSVDATVAKLIAY